MLNPLPRLRNPPLSALIHVHHLTTSCRTQQRLLLRLPSCCAQRHLHTHPQFQQEKRDTPKQEPRAGTTTPTPEDATTAPAPAASTANKCPFYFEAGYALFAKRPSRPFPPPFLSYPSGSFSEPLSTHNRSRDRRPYVNGEMIRGVTNGDDAALVSENFIGVDDGVGAWATKERGHAALWSRLILHFWALEAETYLLDSPPNTDPDPTSYLQTAYDHTKEATSTPNEWYGTTTACGALLTSTSSTSPTPTNHNNPHPTLHITQLGDSQILVLRPRTQSILFKTTEQWHWFDCPRQLGTNSPDTPAANAVTSVLQVEEDDVVLAMSDGVVDNLWEHEVVSNVLDSMDRWRRDEAQRERKEEGIEPAEQSWFAHGMRFVARELVARAREIAEDPFAESPYMEKAIDEGLSIEGGKLDDITVVAAQCKRRKG